MVCRPAADSYRCRPAIMHDLCDRTALLLDVLQLSKISKRATGWVDQAPSYAATSNSLLMN